MMIGGSLERKKKLTRGKKKSFLSGEGLQSKLRKSFFLFSLSIRMRAIFINFLLVGGKNGSGDDYFSLFFFCSLIKKGWNRVNFEQKMGLSLLKWRIIKTIFSSWAERTKRAKFRWEWKLFVGVCEEIFYDCVRDAFALKPNWIFFSFSHSCSC